MSDSKTDRNRRILIIDDNPAIHEDFRKILLAESESEELLDAAAAFFGESTTKTDGIDASLECASQGQEGVALCQAAVSAGTPFAVAFVDMRMPPGWDGLKTISELWKVDPNLQVVICSAYSDHSWTQIRQDLGATDRLLILKKPFDNSEVLQLATALIEKRHVTEQAALRAVELEAMVEERTKHWRQAERESDLLISAIDSMLVSVDENGRINRWTQPSELLFGLPPNETVGKNLVDLPIQWDDPAAIPKLLQQQSSRAEVAFCNHLDEYRVLGMSSYPIVDDGKYRGTLLIGLDLTEHRALELQLHQAQKLESVGQLAAGVAHEINTPMQYLGDNLGFLQKKVGQLEPIIKSLQQFLEAESNGQESALTNLNSTMVNFKADRFVSGLLEAIEDSRDGVQHVSKIVTAMREFAHPGQEEKIPVDVNRALDSTITVSTNEWKYVAEIVKEFDESNPTVHALPVELNQVFLNILVNAAHAVSDVTDAGAKGKGTIIVRTEVVEGDLQVSIQDSGTGISEKNRSKIFDPFFTTKDVGKGTGQGLSIAHSVVVNQHGGRLWCESTIGQGTTFFMQFPMECNSSAETTDQNHGDLVRAVS
ncbi:MAG: ATP-binding protein [Fuerstiella sp.]